MTATQEQLDKYAAERIQPLADALQELSQSSGYNVNEYYQAVSFVTMHMLQRIFENGAKDKRLLNTVEFLLNIATRMAEAELEGKA
jgi:hypothetical protein